jgi:hypothetical protein
MFFLREHSKDAMANQPEVLISEVGPRDGLQSVKATMPTADKLRWIDALAAAGLREIEVCSFVPARLLPQMAAAAEVVRHALTHPGVTFMFEAMGVETGVSLDKLLAARLPLTAGLPGEPLYGMTPEAGLPKGWMQGAVHV